MDSTAAFEASAIETVLALELIAKHCGLCHRRFDGYACTSCWLEWLFREIGDAVLARHEHYRRCLDDGPGYGDWIDDGDGVSSVHASEYASGARREFGGGR